MLNKRELRLKKLYRSLSVVFSVLLAVGAIIAVFSYVERKVLYPLNYKAEICRYADEFGLERSLVFAVVKTESDFDAYAVSNVGAKGLMQLTEETGKYVAGKLGVESFNLFDVSTSILFGCYYIRYLINKFIVVDTALIAYNAGEGNVAKWLEDNHYSSDGKTLYSTPFAETNSYIMKIRKNFSKYKKLYGNILDKR